MSKVGQIWTLQGLMRTFEMLFLEHFRQLQFKTHRKHRQNTHFNRTNATEVLNYSVTRY